MREIGTRVHLVSLRATREGATEAESFIVEAFDGLPGLRAEAEEYGLDLQIDVSVVSVADAGDLLDWLTDANASLTPKPTHVRPQADVLIDELRRAQRNTDRRLEQLTEMMTMLVGRVSETVAREPGATAANALQDAAVARLAPVDRSGRAPAIERGEHSEGDATRHLAEQRTGRPGLLNGNMALRGSPASSEVYGVGTDADGNPAAVRVAMPKVGDSLKPPHLRNG